jgi:hypothetical protein
MALSYEPSTKPDNLDATLAEIEERDRLLDNAAAHYFEGGWLLGRALDELDDAGIEYDEADIRQRAMALDWEGA